MAYLMNGLVGRFTLGTIFLIGTSNIAYAQQLPVDDAAFDEPDSEDGNDRRSRGVNITPYIEVGQVLLAQLTPGDEVLTYSVVSVGVDASARTARAEGQVSVRYERRIDYGDDIGDQDILSGIARGSYSVVPGALTFDAGALATRTSIDARGIQPANFVGNIDNVTQVYTAFAGPTLATNVGNVAVNGLYRVGYTTIENENNIAIAAGQPALDLFDESISQVANISIGQQPNVSGLPVGWSLSAGYRREDTSQLDQRVEDISGRADLTVPLTPTFALVGGIGYEDVSVSERDALRDGAGNPIVGPDGRLVVDSASPRLLSFNTDGLIWDAGVLWRPGARTSLEARVGRRFGSTTYNGSFNYQPNTRTVFSIAAFDTIAGFGGLLNDNLALLPTQFDTFRNPLTGDLNNNILGNANNVSFNNALQTASSSVFRTRGVTAALSTQLGTWQTGFAAGYNRRNFLNSELGALANIAGNVDENVFGTFFASTQIDRASSFNTAIFANYLNSGFEDAGDVFTLGANAAYLRSITRGLTASAALGIDSVDQEGFDDQVTASALLGLRYSF